MSYVFGIGWDQHRGIIVGYPLQGVGAAEVTYTCKMDPLYGDIVSGRKGHRATRLQFPVQFRTPQHLRKLNPNTDPYFLGMPMRSYINRFMRYSHMRGWISSYFGQSQGTCCHSEYCSEGRLTHEVDRNHGCVGPPKQDNHNILT